MRAEVTQTARAHPGAPSSRWSFQRLIGPLVLSILAAGWIGIYAQIRIEAKEAQAAALATARNRAMTLEQHVEKMLQVASLASLHLGESHLLSHGTSGADAANPNINVDQSVVEIAGLSGVAYWDRDGRRLAASGAGKLVPDRDTLNPDQALPWGANLTLGGPYQLGNSPEKLLLVTRRVVRDGSILGYVGLFLRPAQFLNFPSGTRFRRSDLVSVIGLNGITLARREGDTISSGQNLAGTLVMREQFANPNGSYVGPSALDGHVRYFCHRRLEDIPVFVTAGVSRSAALASTQRRAVIYLSTLGVLSVFGLLFAWLLRRKIADRESKALELADSARRLREAQHIGKIGDWDYDLDTDILSWSHELCEMYERPPGDDLLTLADFTAYLVPEDRGMLSAFFDELAQIGGEGAMEFQTRLPSGKTSQRCLNARAAADPEGKIVRLYGTDQDVTHSHRLSELEMQVAHVDRQGAMSMMAATLAHELNQPLTAASNYLAAAMRAAVKVEGARAAPVTAGMRYALAQINDAAEIIRGARKIVKVDADESAAASIPDVVASTIALLTASGFSGARDIRVECEPAMPQANISQIQLKQVLLNLLRNALEAAPRDEPRIVLTAKREDDGMLRIEISDNGPGFPSSPFDAFSLITTKLSGLGLGLSVSRTIVEHYAGKIWIEKSGPGETTIAILLPVVSAEAQALAGSN